MVQPADLLSMIIKQDGFLRSILSPGVMPVKRKDKISTEKFKFSDLTNPSLRGIVNEKRV